jgi:septal ring factor EnvC (AmiA/AmiB activator)
MTTDITILVQRLKVAAKNGCCHTLFPDDCQALVEALEKAQRANAAQDDHINQQQDRIDQLEKGHQEAAKQINSWRRMAKQNIAEREKDIAELDAARQRIAELESRAVTVENLQESAYRAGLTAGWNLGLANNNDGFNKCLAAHAAGIKVEAE